MDVVIPTTPTGDEAFQVAQFTVILERRRRRASFTNEGLFFEVNGVAR